MTRCIARGSDPGTPELAKAYAQRTQWQRARGLNLLDLAAPDTGQTVLDLGCGTGELTVELARRVGPRGRVYGIDPDAARLNRAKALLPETSENVEYHRATAERMDLIPTRAVDLIYSNYVIHWVRDVPGMLDEVERVLKPGGRLVAEFAGAPTEALDDLMRLMPGGAAFSSEHSFLGDSDWRAAVRARKLRIFALRRLDLSLLCENRSELFGWLEATSNGAFRPSLLRTADRVRLEATYPGRVQVPIRALSLSLERICEPTASAAV